MDSPLSPPTEPAIPPTATWSTEATRTLIEAWNAGAAPTDLARRFGVSTGAIYARVRGLRRRGVCLEARRTPTADNLEPALRPRQRSRRTCLTCGKKFRSTHIGNRICEPCLLVSGLF